MHGGHSIRHTPRTLCLIQHHNQFYHTIEDLDLTKQLAISQERLQQIYMCEATVQDPNLRVITQVASLTCMVDHIAKSCVPVEVNLKLYLRCHNELSTAVQNGLSLKGHDMASKLLYQ